MATATVNDSTLESHALYSRAVEKINRSKFGDALDLLTEALRIAPRNPLYRSQYGLCIAYTKRDYPRAIEACRQALEIHTSDPTVRINLGRIYRLMGNNAAAYDQFCRAWKRHGAHPLTAAELTRMGIRRPPFFTFLPRQHWANRYLGLLRAVLERKLVGRRQS